MSHGFLNFREERDARTTSWKRGDPRTAIIERSSPIDYQVMLRDGEESHSVVYGRERGAYVGSCDCKGFEFRDDEASPCAHLCALRKAEALGLSDLLGRSLSAVETANVEKPAHEREATIRADGGTVQAPPAGHDRRVFGRPEGRL